MSGVNFAEMSSKELVEWYNERVAEDKRIKKFSDRKTAERRCVELTYSVYVEEEDFKLFKTGEPPIVENVVVETVRPNMVSSLRLDRRITRLDSGQIWKNAHTMWVQNPDWMTSSQQDRLTVQLYKAAKAGQKITVTVNGVEFQLLNV